jgi:hypothetical protein
MELNEVDDLTFEKAVKEFSIPKPETDEKPKYMSYGRDHDPINFNSYEIFEIFNRTDEPDNPSFPWVDNPEKEEEFKKKGIPPLPQYNQKNRSHKVTLLEHILYEPERKTRPEK